MGENLCQVLTLLVVAVVATLEINENLVNTGATPSQLAKSIRQYFRFSSNMKHSIFLPLTH